MCTFEECSHPNKVYGSRHEWYNHEAQIHRARWICRACRETFNSKSNFIGHVQRQHPSGFAEEQLPAFLQMCLVPADKGTVGECDFCSVPGQILYKHMAHHMKALALFAVPRKNNGNDDEAGSKEGQAGASDDASILGKSRERMSSSGSISEISEDAKKVPEDVTVEIGQSTLSEIYENDEIWTDSGHESAMMGPIHDFWDRAYEISSKKDSWPSYENSLLQELESDILLTGSSMDNHVKREELMSKLVLKKSKIFDGDEWSSKLNRSPRLYPVVRIWLLVKENMLSGSETNQHVALAWAGVFMLLPHIMTPLIDFQGKEDEWDLAEVEEALEYISVLINRLTIIQRIYLEENAASAASGLRERELLKASFETQMTRFCSRIVSSQAHAVSELLTKKVPADQSPLPRQMSSLKVMDDACQEVFSIVDSAKLKSALTTEGVRMDELLRRQSAKWQVQDVHASKTREGDSTEREPISQARAIECLNALRNSFFEDGKNQNFDRFPGTFQWFLEHPKYDQWLQSPRSSDLWVDAEPGWGKSVLLKSLIDDELQSRTSTTVCYYFFRDDDTGRMSMVDALFALLYQICDQNRELLKTVDEVLRQNGGKVTPSIPWLWKLLLLLARLSTAGSIICLLDALDECEETGRRRFLNSLEQLRSYMDPSYGRLMFLVTSRSPPDLKGYRDLVFLRVCGDDEREAMKKDVDLVIENRIPWLATQMALDDESRAALLSRLLQVQNPTQLWLHLTLAALEETAGVSGSKGMTRFIEQIPETLNEAYRSLLKLSPQPEQASKLLHIVVASVRPLTLRELNLALHVREGQKSIEDVPLQPEQGFAKYINNLCGSMVSIYHGRVYLVHKTASEWWADRKSAREFRYRLDSTLEEPTHPSEPVQSHFILASICLVYIAFDVFEVDPLPSDPIEEGIHQSSNKAYRSRQCQVLEFTQKHDFMNYAAVNWSDHFRWAGQPTDMLQRWIMVCEPRSKRFFTWFRIYWYGHDLRNDLEKEFCKIPKMTDLAVASYLRHFRVVKQFVERRQEFEPGRGQEWSALFTAINVGEKGIATFLIDHGASIDNEEIEGWTLLGLVASKGFDELALRLLHKGANIEQQTRRSGITALMRASEAGQIFVVKTLLRFGANINAESNTGRTALMEAAWGGHEGTVDLLLQNGADVKACTHTGRTALHDAIRGSHEIVAQMLSKAGAPTDPEDENERTPLSWAAQRGLVGITMVLITSGACVDSMDDQSMTPLLHAVRGGHGATVRELLKAGADVDGSDGQNQTALSRAVQLKDQTMIRILLENKADTEIPDERGLTPLLHASLHANTAVMKILLEAGANPDAADDNGQTSLVYVVYPKREQQTVENIAILHQAGANINATDHAGRTAVSHVSFEYQHGVKRTRALVNAGADVNIADHQGRTPLHYAVAKKRENLEVLLLAGADINAQDKEGKTPLDLAKEQGDEKVIALLERRF